MMKRQSKLLSRVLLLLMLMAVTSWARAADVKFLSLNVNGTPVVINLAEPPKITYTGNVLHIQTGNSETTVDVPVANIQATTFQELSEIIGDANNDGHIDVADVVAVVNDILENPASSFVKKFADVNNDGNVDVADVVQIVNLILQGK